jgi:hypothetical protein
MLFPFRTTPRHQRGVFVFRPIKSQAHAVGGTANPGCAPSFSIVPPATLAQDQRSAGLQPGSFFFQSGQQQTHRRAVSRHPHFRDSPLPILYSLFLLNQKSKSNSKEKAMPSLTAKDRAPLCLFSYEDGRRCRTPRIASHPHFCFYHAQKESQSQAAEKLADDLAYFFSGKYLTANDLNAALGRLIPAVIRGEIKPRLARTVAYMLQTLMQSTRQAQHEYINAFSTDGWRQAVANSVHNNHDHLYSPSPAESASPTPVGAGLARPASPSQPDHPERSTPAPPPPEPTQAGHAACPEERRERSEGPRLDRASSPTDEIRHPTTTRTSAAEAALAIARNLFPERPNTTKPTQPAPPTAAAASAATTNPATPTQNAQPAAPTPPPQPPAPRRQPGAPTRDPYAVHFDHTHRLYIDGKPWQPNRT